MAEKQAPHAARGSGTGQERDYLPAMAYRRLLPLYDTVTRLTGLPRVHRDLTERADLRPGQRVLEIGCGTGSLLLLVRRRHPDVDLVGLDPDPDALHRARRKLAGAGPAVRLDRGFADALPYPDTTVDRVLSSFMWHHLDPADKPRALREIRRVLRPGGQLHIVDMSGGGPIHRALTWRGRRHGHARHVPDRADELSAQLREAGLTGVTATERRSVRLGGYAFYRASR
jgi:ubiquinone/menaquinone biosynthesis C-methylase UbiE